MNAKWLLPENYLDNLSKCSNIFAVLSFVIVSVGLVWGLFFTPFDFQQGVVFRIIYVHVPAAFSSLFLYTLMTVFAMFYLIFRVKLFGILALSIVPVNFSFCLIALITGSLWGKPTWGTYWIWDARLTSMFILWLTLTGLMLLKTSIAQEKRKLLSCSVLTLLGAINLPIIHFSVKWWATLHQGSTLTILQKPSIAPVMLHPLLVCLFGFLGLAVTCVLLQFHNQILQLKIARLKLNKLFSE